MANPLSAQKVTRVAASAHVTVMVVNVARVANAMSSPLNAKNKLRMTASRLRRRMPRQKSHVAPTLRLKLMHRQSLLSLHQHQPPCWLLKLPLWLLRQL